jgi:hypothetical protein
MHGPGIHVKLALMRGPGIPVKFVPMRTGKHYLLTGTCILVE